MNTNWLKLAQKLFILCIVLGLIVIAYSSIVPSSNNNESLGFAMYILGFPFIALLSLLVVIGSVINLKRLSKADWTYFGVSALLLIGSVVMVAQFYR